MEVVGRERRKIGKDGGKNNGAIQCVHHLHIHNIETPYESAQTIPVTRSSCQVVCGKVVHESGSRSTWIRCTGTGEFERLTVTSWHLTIHTSGVPYSFLVLLHNITY